MGGCVRGMALIHFVIRQTLKVEYSIVHSYCERAVVFVIDANDGPLQSNAATTRTSLHLLLGLKNGIQISPAQLLTSLSLSSLPYGQ